LAKKYQNNLHGQPRVQFRKDSQLVDEILITDLDAIITEDEAMRKLGMFFSGMGWTVAIITIVVAFLLMVCALSENCYRPKI
jgi:hypothetical protein